MITRQPWIRAMVLTVLGAAVWCGSALAAGWMWDTNGDRICGLRVARIAEGVVGFSYDGLDFVDVLNSWGRGYPHLTRMPAKVLERLWKEDGEVGIVTDR